MAINALLVYPEFPPSYWGYQYALPFAGKKSNMPPLGLLTVAAMFPKEYRLKVVDMNVEPLTDAHLRWADMVFTSTMLVQQESLREVIGRCNRAGIPIVAGGPYPTSYHEGIEGVDYFLLDEVEETFGGFLQDLKNGTAKKMYRATRKPDVTQTPAPRLDLVKWNKYGSMALQFSRGCPFDCEFCDITKLYGRVPRVKTTEQMLSEFQGAYDLGWRGPVFVVDDNFIGNKKEAMRFLPALAEWQKERGRPFSLYTEASVNLAEMTPLMDAMVEANFDMVFLGIETPNPETLLLTHKKQNTKAGEDDFLLRAVRAIQQRGMQVTAGFILGLDGDRENVFDAQINFIQKAGIPTAMVGLLTALNGTNLFHRLAQENRLLTQSTGNNVSFTLNFKTQMDPKALMDGYKRVLTTLYDSSLRNYFDRCLTLFKHLKPDVSHRAKIGHSELLAFAKSLTLQLLSKQGPAYAKFLTKTLIAYPARFSDAVKLAICGYHYQKITSQQIALHNLTQHLEEQFAVLKQMVASFGKTHQEKMAEVHAFLDSTFSGFQAHCERIHRDFQGNAQKILEDFQATVEAYLQASLGAAASVTVNENA